MTYPDYNLADEYDDDDSDDSTSRGGQYIDDVRETSHFGRAVIEPSVHFRRIFALFAGNNG